MGGSPITLVTSGGIPVTNTAYRGPAFTPVASGGIPATLVASGGMPVTLVNADGSLWVDGGERVNGFAIGDAGPAGTPYEGMTLLAGDDFATLPSRYTNESKAGRYSSSPMHSGSRRSQNNFSTATTDAMIYTDPLFRGARSQLASPLAYDPLAASASVLTITASTAPDPLKAVSPAEYSGGGGDANNKPTLMSGRLNSWPSFMLSVAGDWCFAVKVQFPAGGVIPGYWPSAWLSSFLWPDYQEYDLFEGRSSGANRFIEANINGSTADFGGNITQNMVPSTRQMPTGRFVTMVVRKEGTTFTHYDDAVVEGTLALVTTYTDARVSRFRGAHDVRLEFALNAAWQAYSYSAGDWPKELKFDWWQAWSRPGTQPNVPLSALPTVQTTPGGNWTATIPAAAAIYGFTPDFEEIYSAFGNLDDPGAPSKSTSPNFLPGGMSINKTTRAITGTVPSTEGGRTAIMLIGSKAAGGAAVRVIKYFEVAPAPQSSLFSNGNSNVGDAVSLTIAQADFHSGNLGPHTYNVTKTAGGTDFTVTGNGTSQVTIAGTVATSETTTFQIECTNAIGQKTTVTRTRTVAAAVNPNADYFSDGAGGFPVGWTDQWATGENWTENAGGFLRAVPASTLRGALSFDQIGSVLNVEMLAKLRTSGFADGASYEGVIVRGGGAAGTETGYRFLMGKSGTSPAIVLVRFISGTALVLATVPLSWSANNWYWMRASVNGNTLRARVWADGSSEGAAYSIDLSDTGITSAGWAGVGVSANGNSDWDQVSYALSGATAQP